MYEILVFVHIASAMVWVGGGFVLIAVERMSFKTGGISGAYQMMKQLAWVDDWIFTPAPLLVIATGVTMVIMSDAWAFSQAWVYLALGLIALEFIVGSRDEKKMKAAVELGGDSPEFAAALPSYLRMAVGAIGMLAVIVLLMVFKPGA